MRITKQSNPNECGVCVINSLVEHFYHKSIKLDILHNAKITSEGLSIFNFECLAQQYGIFVETFQLDWNEFIALHHKDYMVCPIKRGNGLHYVIIKKSKGKVKVYDSVEGEQEINIHELAEKFNGIIMMVTKNNYTIDIKRLNKVDLLHNLNWKYLILCLLLHVAIIALGAISADYFNMMINHAIASQSLSNGFTITFTFLIFSVLEELIHYLLSLHIAKHFKMNFQYLSHKFIQVLSFKKKSLLHKIDRNYFYLIDTAMQSITIFLVSEIAMLCSNVLLSFVVIIIIVIIDPWFLIIIALSIFMIAIFNYVRYQYRKDLMKIGIENQRVNNGISHNYVNYLKDQSNYVVQQNLNIELEQNYSDYQRIYLSQAKFNSGFNFCENLFQKIIYLTIIMLGCYLIIDHKTLNIGELTFLVSLISMAMSAINGICDFVVKGNEYTQMSEIYQNFITLENRSNKTGTKINQIKNIKIHGKTIQSGETLLNNDEILDIITLEKEKNDLEINNIHCDLISQTDYLSKMFVININTKISKDWLYKKFDHTNAVFIESLKKFNINLSNLNMSNIYEQVLVNVLATILVEDMIVVLDDTLRYVTAENKKWINTIIFPYLAKHNFLLILNNE